jgi:hypothetical protein
MNDLVVAFDTQMTASARWLCSSVSLTSVNLGFENE